MAGPSKGPDRHRRKKTPHPTSSLGHPLPRGEGTNHRAFRRAENPLVPLPKGEGTNHRGLRRAQNPLFPLPGERVDRAARFHQRARDGGPTFC